MVYAGESPGKSHYSPFPLQLGYFTTGHRMTAEELSAVQGRLWEE